VTFFAFNKKVCGQSTKISHNQRNFYQQYLSKEILPYQWIRP